MRDYNTLDGYIMERYGNRMLGIEVGGVSS